MPQKPPSQLMLEAPVGRALFSLSWPTVIASTIVAMSNLIDLVVLGKALGVKAIGGLAVVFPLQLIFLGVGQGIAAGGSSIISRNLGSGDEEGAKRTFAHVLLVITLLSMLFFISAFAYLPELLRQFGATEELLPLAVPFARVTIIGYFFSGLSLALNSTVRSEGYALPSMISRLLTVGIKIALTWVLVMTYHKGMTGAALATLLSHLAAVLYIAVDMLRRRSVLIFSMRHIKIDWGLLRNIINLSTSTFIVYFAGTVTSVIINRTLSTPGSAIHLATYGVIHRIRVFLYTPIFGLNQGLAPLVGFNAGRGRMDRVKTAFTLALMSALGLLILLTFLFQLFPSETMSFFARGSQFEQAGDLALRTSTLLIALTSLPIVLGTFTLSLGYSGLSSLLSLSRQILFFIPFAILFHRLTGIIGIWYAYLLSDLLSFLLGLVIAHHIFKKLYNTRGFRAGPTF